MDEGSFFVKVYLNMFVGRLANPWAVSAFDFSRFVSCTACQFRATRSALIIKQDPNRKREPRHHLSL